MDVSLDRVFPCPFSSMCTPIWCLGRRERLALLIPPSVPPFSFAVCFWSIHSQVVENGTARTPLSSLFLFLFSEENRWHNHKLYSCSDEWVPVCRLSGHYSLPFSTLIQRRVKARHTSCTHRHSRGYHSTHVPQFLLFIRLERYGY